MASNTKVMEAKWELKVTKLSIDLHLISSFQIPTKNTNPTAIQVLRFLSSLMVLISKGKSLMMI